MPNFMHFWHRKQELERQAHKFKAKEASVLRTAPFAVQPVQRFEIELITKEKMTILKQGERTNHPGPWSVHRQESYGEGKVWGKSWNATE